MRRVLLVSSCFPPQAAMGALRASKLAKYLARAGWECTVLTLPESQYQLRDMATAEDLPAAVRVIRIAARFMRRWPAIASQETGSSTRTGRLRALLRAARRAAHRWIIFPDASWSWLFAWPAISRAVASTGPYDVVFSTAEPYTNHLVARWIKRKFDVPLVCDFRDAWSDNHYLEARGPKRALTRYYEQVVLNDADRVTAVTPGIATQLQRKARTEKVVFLPNGYDPEEVSEPLDSPNPRLTVTCTGQLLAGKRDPSLLFRALKELDEEGGIPLASTAVHYYGLDGEIFLNSAVRWGVAEAVTLHGRVPRATALRAQRTADVLLLLLWNAPGEETIYPGKLLEYLGAQRPILYIGPAGGAADLLAETGAGCPVYTNDIEQLKQLLRRWHVEFAEAHRIHFEGKAERLREFGYDRIAERLGALMQHLIDRRDARRLEQA